MTVRLTRTRNGIEYTPEGHFDAREVPCCDAGSEVVAKLSKDYALLKAWMEESYNSNTTARRIVTVPFPQELIHVKEKKKPKSSKESGSKVGVRDGSVGDAEVSGDSV